jgi:hypothetical protein
MKWRATLSPESFCSSLILAVSSRSVESELKKRNETQQKKFRATFSSQTSHIGGSVCTDFTPFYAFCIFSSCAKKAFADTMVSSGVCVCFLHPSSHAHTEASGELSARQCAFPAGVRGELLAKFPEHSHNWDAIHGVHDVKCKRKVNFSSPSVVAASRNFFSFHSKWQWATVGRDGRARKREENSIPFIMK